ncbi:MAG: MoaD/ThiS family protein [Deltaproteobacteria bacterium]|nr:MoaD/ThiS family protein [Deltaproteobacteria bacterium]
MVHLEFWMGEWLGWTGAGPLCLEEPVEDGETVRGLLTRLAGRLPKFSRAVFDPETQSLSSEIALVLNDSIQSLSRGLETPLKEGDRLLFLPILAGG